MNEVASGALIIVAVTIVVLVLQRLLDKVFGAGKIKHAFGDISFFRNILDLIIWFVAAVFIGETVFHVGTENAVVGLGIVSLYLSQGLQDFIKNLVAGLQIIWGGILKAGDHIVVGEHRGEVMDINWRQTVIRDRSGSLRAIPSAMLNSQVLIKREGKMAYRHDVEVEVRHGLDLDVVAADIVRLANEALEELDIKKEGLDAQVRFLGSTFFGVRTSVRFFVKDIQNRTAGVDAVMRAISRTDYLASIRADDIDLIVSGAAPQDQSS